MPNFCSRVRMFREFHFPVSVGPLICPFPLMLSDAILRAALVWRPLLCAFGGAQRSVVWLFSCRILCTRPLRSSGACDWRPGAIAVAPLPVSLQSSLAGKRAGSRLPPPSAGESIPCAELCTVIKFIFVVCAVALRTSTTTIHRGRPVLLDGSGDLLSYVYIRA